MRLNSKKQGGLQRLKRELIKKHPELAGFEEREIPEFLRKHESLAVIKARISRSTTAFSTIIPNLQWLGHTNFHTGMEVYSSNTTW